MGVADGDHPMGSRSRVQLERRLQQVSSGCRGRADVVEIERVERGLQLSHHTNAAGLAGGHRGGHPQQDLDIEQ